ncbi:MAG: SHOCT domain-containing protein [Alphaproteobacteria bacterium]
MNGRFVTLSTVFTVIAAPALAHAGEHGPGAFGRHHWGGMMLGPLAMIVLVLAGIALFVLLVRWFGGGGTGRHSVEKTALDILEERFARGEIEQDEFEARRRVLEK